MKKPSKIECEKCHEPATLTDLHCASCGSRIVKHCGDCGWKLSVLKKFCDSCGEPQEVVSSTPMPRQLGEIPKNPLPPMPRRDKPPVPTPVDPAKEKEPLPLKHPRHLEKGAQNPPKDIPQTIMRRISGERKPAAPPEIRREPPKSPADREHRPHRARKHVTAVKTLVRQRPIFSTLLGMTLLLATTAIYFTVWRSRRTPERLLLKTSAAYLSALKDQRFDTAYTMLSEDSRASCTLERFTRIQESLAWNYDKLRIKSLSPDKALVTYGLLVSGRPAEEDWLHFIFEHGKWRRAYWWHLMPEIEDLLDGGDHAAAAALTEAAMRINPLDPMLSGYLCEAAYAGEEFQRAEKYCMRALDMVKIYPSRMGLDGQIHLRRILADLYRSALEEPQKALAQYDLILADPLLRGKDRCDVRLAAADSQYRLHAYDKSIGHFKEAAQACRNDEELAYLDTGVQILTGQAGPLAVRAVQNHHMPGDKLSLLQWRMKSRHDLAKRLKTRIVRYEAQEKWKADHVSGSEYNVIVENAGSEVLTARIDLWTNKIKVELHVQ